MGRPQFSLRFLLLLAACVSAVSYLLFVRPNVNAARFASAIEENNYDMAESMCYDQHHQNLAERVTEMGDTEVKVSVDALRWRDIWRFKRRLLLQAVPNVPNAKGFRVGLQLDLAATPFGIQRSEFYPVTFK